MLPFLLKMNHLLLFIAIKGQGGIDKPTIKNIEWCRQNQAVLVHFHMLNQPGY